MFEFDVPQTPEGREDAPAATPGEDTGREPLQPGEGYRTEILMALED